MSETTELPPSITEALESFAKWRRNSLLGARPLEAEARVKLEAAIRDALALAFDEGLDAAAQIADANHCPSRAAEIRAAKKGTR